MAAYMSHEYDESLRLAQQAVQLNPEVFNAHNLISRCYALKGDEEKSLGALWAGAHLERNAALWWQIAERTQALGGRDRRAVLDQLTYCYAQMLRLDPDNWDARRARFDVNIEQGYSGKAINEGEKLLELQPFDNLVMEELAKLYLCSGRTADALKLYQDCIQHHIETGNTGVNAFTFSDLNVYLGLFEELDQHREAIHELKSVSRWLLGRQDEVFWDSYGEDDREWDNDDFPRRIEAPEFLQGSYPKETYGEGLPMELRVKLGVYRLRLDAEYLDEALDHFYHLNPGDQGPDSNLQDYYDLFRDVGDVLKEEGFYEEALVFYEPLISLMDHTEVKMNVSIADCYRALGNLQEAEQFLKAALNQVPDQQISDVGQVLNGTEQHTDAVLKLIKIYEEQGLTKQALTQANAFMKTARSKHTTRVPDRRNRFSKVAAQSIGQLRKSVSRMNPDGEDVEGGEDDQSIEGLFLKKPQAPTKKRSSNTKKPSKYEIHQQRDSEVAEAYAALQAYQDGMRADDEEAREQWMGAASDMIEDFRKTKIFFPDEKYMFFWGYSSEAREKARATKKEHAVAQIDAMAERLRGLGTGDQQPIPDVIPDSYRNVPFTVWLDIFCEYALLLAKGGEKDECYAVLQTATEANIWYHFEQHMLHINVTWIACALLLSDENKLLSIARQCIKPSQENDNHESFTTSSYLLYALLARLCPLDAHDLSWYNSGPNQKFLLREVKNMDLTLTDANEIDWRKVPDQEKTAARRRKEKLDDLNPALLVMYGHVLAHAGSYSHALNYYFRAYVVRPDDVLINLSIALAYIQYAMKRQSDNRQYHIIQGLAFLQQYAELRLRSGRALDRQEVEFNRARTWHLLGLTHMAVPAYEKVLELAEEVERERRDEKEEGYEVEAAYCLQQIYVLGGDVVKAREVTERHMVL